MHETLDIRTVPAEEIHPQSCRCFTCIASSYSVPLEDASSEDMARVILHKTENATGLPDHEMRRLALSMVKKARNGAPRGPEHSVCAVWALEGHRGHHWYLSGSYSFICACGETYKEEHDG